MKILVEQQLIMSNIFKMINNTITIPGKILKSEGVVVIPLNEWEKFKEDLEMLRSKKLLKDIAKARNEKKLVPLNKILTKEGLL